MFTFLHAADIHLDSPLRGLARHENAPGDVLRGATREALRNLVRLACDEAVDFVVIAGDLYDGDWPDYNTGLFFAAQMRQLEAAGIPVMLVTGNHDAQSQITKSLHIPANVHSFRADVPDTHVLEELRVAVHGQSFASQAVTENLAAAYPAPVPGLFNLGVLHTALDGRPGHDSYAPCTTAHLTALGYDYWALGHVHHREVISDIPPIVFPGNTQGRHIRETGAKGCYLVHVDDRKRCTLAFHPLDVARWAEITVDISGVEDELRALEACRESLGDAVAEAEGRLLAVRLQLTGATRLHETLTGDRERLNAELLSVAASVSPHQLWLERVLLATSPLADGLNLDSGPLAELLADVAALADQPEAIEAITVELASLEERLPRVLREGADALTFTGADVVAGLVRDSLPVVRTRLQGERG